MHACADRKTHDFFFERDYPDVSFLDALFAKLGPEPQDKAALQAQLPQMIEEFDKALEKLWIHGGAVVEFGEHISRGHDHWRDSYLAQIEQKRRQLDQMLRYASRSQCRMCAVVRHFGDLANAQRPCGQCDFCAPADSIGQLYRPAGKRELAVAAEIIETLQEEGARATGRLHLDLCPNGELTRNEFEELLGALTRAGLIRMTEAEFEKDGKVIPYRKASLTAAGYKADPDNPLELILPESREYEGPPPRSRRKQKRGRQGGSFRRRKSRRRH